MGKRGPATVRTVWNGQHGYQQRLRLYVEEIIANGGNANKAALAVGYKPGLSAYRFVGRMAKNKEVQDEIASRRAGVFAKAQEKTQLTADDILASLARDIHFDPVRAFRRDGKLIPFEDMDENTRRALRGLSFDARGRPNIKFPEPASAREQAMKHLGMFEKDNTQQRPFANMTDEQLDAAIARLQKQLAE